MKIHKKSLRQIVGVLILWFALIVMRQVPVGGEWGAVSYDSLAFLFCWMTVYFLGWILAASTLRFPQSQLLDTYFCSERYILGFALMAAVGAILLTLEFAVMRGYGFGMSVSEIRGAEISAVTQGREGSILSGIGRVLMPALLVAWIYFRQSPLCVGFKSRWSLFLSTAIVLFAQASFEGGRFFLAALLMVIWLSGNSAKSLQNKKSNRFIWVFVLAALFYSGYVFIDRFSGSQFQLSDRYLIFTNRFSGIDVDWSVYNKLNGSHSAQWLVLMMFWVYITQSINEFDVVYSQAEIAPALGGYQVPLLMKIITVITGKDLHFDAFATLNDPGVYISLPGSAYVDFNHYGSLVYALVLGSVTGRAVERHNRNHKSGVSGELSGPLFLVIAFLSPVNSMLGTIWPAIIFLWLLNLRERITRTHGAPYSNIVKYIK